MSDRNNMLDGQSSIVSPQKLNAINAVFAMAWQMLIADGHTDEQREHHQRARLAGIVLDCLVAGQEPTAATAAEAVERFLNPTESHRIKPLASDPENEPAQR